MAEKISIQKTLRISEVEWTCVNDTLRARCKGRPEVADRGLRLFRELFEFPTLARVLFGQQAKSEELSAVLSSICRCHGCDELILEKERLWLTVPVRFGYDHSVKASLPGVGKIEASEARFAIAGTMRILVGPFVLSLKTYWSYLAAYIAIIMAAGAFYALAFAVIAYGLVVLAEFARNPAALTIEATRHSTLGIALLAILVGVAALFGRAVGFIARGARKLLRRPR